LAGTLSYYHILGLTRGLPVFDEANYIISYEMAKSSFFPYITLAPWLLNTILPSEFSFTTLRIYNIIFKILAATTIAYSTFKLHQASKMRLTNSGFLLIPAVLFAAFFSSAFALSTISYNGMTEIALLLAESALFYGVLKNSKPFFFVSGFILWYLVYTKIPVFAIGTGFLIAVTLAMLNTWYLRGRALIFAFLGTLFNCIIGLWTIVSLEQWKIHILNRTSDETGTHLPGAVLKNFLKSIFVNLGEYYLLWLALAAVVVLIFFCLRKRNQQTKIIGLGVSALLLSTSTSAILVWRFYPKFFRNNFTIHIFILTTILFFFYILAHIAKRRSIDRKIFNILICLWLNPLLCAVGSYNGFPQLGMFPISWFILTIFIIIFFINEESKLLKIFSISTMVVIFSLSHIFLTRYIVDEPYDSPVKLASQNTTVTHIRKIQGRMVDADTAAFFNELNQTLKNYPHHYYLQLANYPGLMYPFARRYLIEEPWLQVWWPESKKVCKMLSEVSQEKKDKAIFLVHEESVKSLPVMLRQCLTEFGLTQNMQKVKSVTSKYYGDIAIYVSRQHHHL